MKSVFDNATQWTPPLIGTFTSVAIWDDGVVHHLPLLWGWNTPKPNWTGIHCTHGHYFDASLHGQACSCCFCEAMTKWERVLGLCRSSTNFIKFFSVKRILIMYGGNIAGHLPLVTRHLLLQGYGTVKKVGDGFTLKHDTWGRSRFRFSHNQHWSGLVEWWVSFFDDWKWCLRCMVSF